jgi:hypothetical protein
MVKPLGAQREGRGRGGGEGVVHSCSNVLRLCRDGFWDSYVHGCCCQRLWNQTRSYAKRLLEAHCSYILIQLGVSTQAAPPEKKTRGDFPWKGVHATTKARLWISTKQDRHLLMCLWENGKMILSQRVDHCGAHCYMYSR